MCAHHSTQNPVSSVACRGQGARPSGPASAAAMNAPGLVSERGDLEDLREELGGNDATDHARGSAARPG